jgi:hypothetical protein
LYVQTDTFALRIVAELVVFVGKITHIQNEAINGFAIVDAQLISNNVQRNIRICANDAKRKSIMKINNPVIVSSIIVFVWMFVFAFDILTH